MTKKLFLAYAGVSYALFFAAYAYFCLFMANLWVPRSVDGPATGGGTSSVAAALAINGALVALFGLQHSVMARPGFKRVWTRIVPQPIERATYVFVSSIALFALLWFWRPMTAVVWNVEQPIGRTLLWALFAAGWLMVPAVSHLINHYDLFGLRQVWLHYQGKEYESLPFRTPMLYAHVRHPLYVGWAIAFWATPTMTVGHALLATLLTGYMVVATFFEERDLVAHFGDVYADYSRRVPKFVPRLWGRAGSGETAPLARRG